MVEDVSKPEDLPHFHLMELLKRDERAEAASSLEPMEVP